MHLEEACALAQAITHIPITRLETPAQRAEFCRAHRFHPAQDYLTPPALERMLAGLAPGEPLGSADLFQVRFIFCRIGAQSVALGPYCTEFFSLSDCEILLRQAGLRNYPPRDLLARRGQLTVCPESVPLHAARCLARTSALVQEVAASVGILDANYFVKRFKAAFGTTPTEFRRRYGI